MGALTQDLNYAVAQLEADHATPKVSRCPSPGDNALPAISQLSSIQPGSAPASNIWDFSVVPASFFNQALSGSVHGTSKISWADEVQNTEDGCFPMPATNKPSDSASDFHSSLYGGNEGNNPHPQWYHLSQGDGKETLPGGFGH
jgi:hypothetical protein